MKRALVLTAAFLAMGVIGWQVGLAMAERTDDQPTLPDAAKKAVADAFPKGTIDKIEMEKAGVKVYEVDLKVDGKAASILVAPDGTVLKMEIQLASDALPATVKAAVEKETAGAKVLAIEKEEKLAGAKIVKLEKAQIEYEVKMTKDGKTWELEMDADGKVTEKKEAQEEKEEKGQKGDKEEQK
ncbi:MAG: PepSY-like domain-containing protein [Planctomycetota bacterium]|nr:PepSY-like domain-containing protein [Planctomycetota bacterium]